MEEQATRSQTNQDVRSSPSATTMASEISPEAAAPSMSSTLKKGQRAGWEEGRRAQCHSVGAAGGWLNGSGRKKLTAGRQCRSSRRRGMPWTCLDGVGGGEAGSGGSVQRLRHGERKRAVMGRTYTCSRCGRMPCWAGGLAWLASTPNQNVRCSSSSFLPPSSTQSGRSTGASACRLPRTVPRTLTACPLPAPHDPASPARAQVAPPSSVSAPTAFATIRVRPSLIAVAQEHRSDPELPPFAAKCRHAMSLRAVTGPPRTNAHRVSTVAQRAPHCPNPRSGRRMTPT